MSSNGNWQSAIGNRKSAIKKSSGLYLYGPISVWRFGYVHLLKFPRGAAAADALAGAFGAYCCATRCCRCPARHPYQRSQGELMLWQDLARRLAKSQRSNREDGDGCVEDYANNEHEIAWNYTYRSSIDKGIEVASRQGMQVNLKVPTQSEQGKYPKVVAAQASAYRFPLSNSEMGRY
jgi:hypothetical protein